MPGHPAFGNGRYRTTRHSTIAPHPTQIASAATASNRDRRSSAAQMATASASSAHAGPARRMPTAAATAGPSRHPTPARRSLATESDQSRWTRDLDVVAAPREEGECDAQRNRESAQPQPDGDGALRGPSERHRSWTVRRGEAPAVEATVDELGVPEISVAVDVGDPSVVEPLAEYDPAAGRAWPDPHGARGPVLVEHLDVDLAAGHGFPRRKVEEHEAVDVDTGLETRPALDPDRVELRSTVDLAAMTPARRGHDRFAGEHVGDPDGAEVERHWQAIDA